MNELRRLGDWLREDFRRVVAVVAILFLLNLVLGLFLEGNAQIVLSELVFVALVLVGLVYLLGSRS